jgi:processive 1,2-diacylglycerol beta-glucosyltransferase
MKILILTAGYGEGHNSAARALKSAFDEQPGIEAELVDIFALRAPRFNNLSRRGYIKVINSAPKLWSRFFRWLDESKHAPAMMRTLASHRALLGRIIAEKQPIALLSTYPVYSWLLQKLRAEGKVPCPLYTVVTDAITINSLWYRAPSDGWFVTDHDSAAFLRQRGVPAAKVHVSGFPVSLAFADRSAALQPPEPVGPAQSRRVLYMINSSREVALPIVRELLQHGVNWKITFTTGRDARFRQEIEQLARQAPGPTEVLGWTDRIPELLMTHHVVISKAGGATTQESINALCPLIVSQIVPGQEEGNYELLRRSDAGVLATTPAAIVAQVQVAFAKDASLWSHWRKNLRKIAHPAAARSIATHVLEHSVAGSLVAK